MIEFTKQFIKLKRMLKKACVGCKYSNPHWKGAVVCDLKSGKDVEPDGVCSRFVYSEHRLESITSIFGEYPDLKRHKDIVDEAKKNGYNLNRKFYKEKHFTTY